MANSLKLYRRYIGISMRSQMQYRVSFITQSFAQFFITAFEFMAVWALFARFKTLRGWTLPEVALFYGMISTAFALGDAISFGFDQMGKLIKKGELDRILLRPRSSILQILGYEFSLRRIGRLSQGLAVLGWALSALNLHWSMGKLLLIPAAIAASVCLFLALFIIQATIAFWTIESLEIMNSLTYGGVTTAQYPMSIYSAWFRKFFTFFVPLACVNYYPVLAILDKPDPLGTPLWFQYLAPLAGILFLLASLGFWRWGLKHYSSTGS